MQGYISIAIGNRYLLEAINLIETLRIYDDKRPFSIVIAKEDFNYAKKLNIFDKIFIFDECIEKYYDKEILAICNHNFEKYSLIPKIHLHKYPLYDETICIDSDVLCINETNHVWELFGSSDYPVNFTGRPQNPAWHWGRISDVEKVLNKQIPETHSGLMYFRKCKETNEFFNSLKEIVLNYDNFNAKRWYGGAMTDEILYAIASAKFNYFPFDFYYYPLMTFNATDIPNKVNFTPDGRPVLINFLYKSYAFSHMFDKIYGENYQQLFNKIKNRSFKNE